MDYAPLRVEMRQTWMVRGVIYSNGMGEEIRTEKAEVRLSIFN